MSIIQQSETHIKKLLSGLNHDYSYHNLVHTLEVRDACMVIGKYEGLDNEELEILELAALFHDTGFTQKYEGHEFISMKIAKSFLEAHQYAPNKLERVLSTIHATIPENQPQNLLEKVIKDADLVHISSKQYSESLNNLRHEWAVFLQKTFGEREWAELNHKFLKNQDFYTTYAEQHFGEQKKKNQKALKKMAKHLKTDGSIDEMELIASISANKTAQTMFKTALRNHLDLSALADNKANIMLSVNALIITIAAPIAGSFIKGNTYLIIPLVMLLFTCLSSMIYATLATRPIKMGGYTPIENIRKGQSNLFFFGNFFKMNYTEYKQGMAEVLEDETKLDDSIMRDLYFLGNSLGRKYNMLRTCYTIFMIGIISTVFLFLFIYLFYSVK